MQDSETANGENHADTLWRVASGPGADLSCLRQVPAPGPRKGDGANGHFSSVELSSIFCGCSANRLQKSEQNWENATLTIKIEARGSLRPPNEMDRVP